jgi:hypothetical protein
MFRDAEIFPPRHAASRPAALIKSWPGQKTCGAAGKDRVIERHDSRTDTESPHADA